MPDGVLVTPSAAIHGLWDFKKAKTVTAQGLTIDTAEFRARATGSLSISTPDGLSINAKGFYDGIGSSDLMAYGREIDITIPLNLISSNIFTTLGFMGWRRKRMAAA